MNILLIGAPGAGKGSQAKKIVNDYGLVQISTGDLLREAIKNSTEVGLKAKSFMEKGDLVPDAIILDLIENRLKQDDCKAGVIFDGFPRNISQAESLENLLNKLSQKLDYVLNIEVPFEKIIGRLTARRLCKDCGNDYNMITNPPKETGCDNCGGEIIQRPDDNEETIKNRLDVYKKSTEPLIEFYKKNGNLLNIDGDREINVIYSELKQRLK
ncbi:MAG: adenylate kinase [Candidatus Cloacimonadota bacterium]|nr:MAG: adenylate kinase [Candidatus Cloacimonadota bacterium]PIE79140.1 MAG: adenylate kinase [Candidatus Delongbacteria bacterium]